MGVRYLTKFVDENCARWELARRIRGKLVIDGNCVLHSLHTAEWSNGGQYREFRAAVRHFYTALLDSGIVPIVVFDGVDEAKKLDVLEKRKQDWVDTIHLRITDDGTRRSKCHGRILPPLTSEVYRFALYDLRIEFYVCDGEADAVIARLANHYSCPVLSNDSDFFVFRLIGGLIHYSRFYWESREVKADIYHRESFASQLNMKDVALFCVIPAIVGNDFMEPCSPDFITQMLQPLPNGSKCQIKDISRYLSTFASVQDFIRRGFGGKKLESRCRDTIEWYDSRNTLSVEELVETTVLSQKNGSRFPQWLVRLFHTGHLPSSIINASVSGHCLFRVIPDNFHRESSMLAGVSIRQHMYALLQVKEVVEVFRDKLSLTRVRVPKLTLKNEFRGIVVDSIDSLSPSQRERLFYTILKVSDLQSINLRLTGKYCEWRFVAAVTSYWTRTTYPPEHLVKALLLCFMLCSWLSNSQFNRCVPNVPIEFRQSREWLDTLHWLMQWQVIYHTAWTLNALLMEPMSVFSPAFLYDGQVVMYLASSREIDRWLHRVDWKLYDILKEIVFSARAVPLPDSPIEFQSSSESGDESVFESEETTSQEDLTAIDATSTSPTQVCPSPTQDCPSPAQEYLIPSRAYLIDATELNLHETKHNDEEQKTKQDQAPSGSNVVCHMESPSELYKTSEQKQPTNATREQDEISNATNECLAMTKSLDTVGNVTTADGAHASTSPKSRPKHRRKRQKKKPVQSNKRDTEEPKFGQGDSSCTSKGTNLSKPQSQPSLDSVAPITTTLSATSTPSSSTAPDTRHNTNGNSVHSTQMEDTYTSEPGNVVCHVKSPELYTTSDHKCPMKATQEHSDNTANVANKKRDSANPADTVGNNISTADGAQASTLDATNTKCKKKRQRKIQIQPNEKSTKGKKLGQGYSSNSANVSGVDPLKENCFSKPQSQPRLNSVGLTTTSLSATSTPGSSTVPDTRKEATNVSSVHSTKMKATDTLEPGNVVCYTESPESYTTSEHKHHMNATNELSDDTANATSKHADWSTEPVDAVGNVITPDGASSSHKTKAKRKRTRQRNKQVQPNNQDHKETQLGRGDSIVLAVDPLKPNPLTKPQSLPRLDSVASTKTPLSATNTPSSSSLLDTSNGATKQTVQSTKAKVREPEESKRRGSQSFSGGYREVLGGANRSAAPSKARYKKNHSQQKQADTYRDGMMKVKEVQSGKNSTSERRSSITPGLPKTQDATVALTTTTRPVAARASNSISKDRPRNWSRYKKPKEGKSSAEGTKPKDVTAQSPSGAKVNATAIMTTPCFK